MTIHRVFVLHSQYELLKM